ncbi:MAG: hypothetical protein ACI93T_004036, partial [Porticoccaceae bacterium]
MKFEILRAVRGASVTRQRAPVNSVRSDSIWGDYLAMRGSLSYRKSLSVVARIYGRSVVSFERL